MVRAQQLLLPFCDSPKAGPPSPPGTTFRYVLFVGRPLPLKASPLGSDRTGQVPSFPLTILPGDRRSDSFFASRSVRAVFDAIVAIFPSFLTSLLAAPTGPSFRISLQLEAERLFPRPPPFVPPSLEEEWEDTRFTSSSFLFHTCVVCRYVIRNFPASGVFSFIAERLSCSFVTPIGRA